MIEWSEQLTVYLHREPVDFRKAINGLSLIVQDAMALSPFDPALFVFCNQARTQLKALYWDQTGFALWQKRLERERFKWPRRQDAAVIVLTPEQWRWLLRGFDLAHIKPHQPLRFAAAG
jgi:transposase